MRGAAGPGFLEKTISRIKQVCMASAKKRSTADKNFVIKFVDQGTLSCLFEIHYSLSHLGNGKNLMISNSVNTLRQTTFYNQLAYQVIHKQKNQPSAKGKIFA